MKWLLQVKCNASNLDGTLDTGALCQLSLQSSCTEVAESNEWKS